MVDGGWWISGEVGRGKRRCVGSLWVSLGSGGIYRVSGISMDIPEISMFHKQVTLCHQSGDIL